MLPLDIGKAKWRFLAVSHAQTLWSLWLYLGCSAGGLCWAALEISAVKTQQAHPGMWGPRMCCKTRVWSCSEDSFIAIAKKIKADVIGFFGCNMTWCWTRASIYRRSVSQTMLMAVITCQGGDMINNCYNCMVMFACTFYNGFSGKKVTFHHKQKSFYFPRRQKESYYWLWQHYISYEINPFLLIHIYCTSCPSQKCWNYHRLMEYVKLEETPGGQLIYLPWPAEKKGEALLTPEYWQDH